MLTSSETAQVGRTFCFAYDDPTLVPGVPVKLLPLSCTPKSVLVCMVNYMVTSPWTALTAGPESLNRHDAGYRYMGVFYISL